MGKISFESVKQKMYRLSEANSCHKLSCLDMWLQVSFIEPDYKCIVGAVNKGIMRENELHAWNRKALGHLTS